MDATNCGGYVGGGMFLKRSQGEIMKHWMRKDRIGSESDSERGGGGEGDNLKKD